MTPWTAACQASPSITNSRSLSKLISIELVVSPNHLNLCCFLLLPPSIFPSIRVFSNESVLHVRWPKYWNLTLTTGKTRFKMLISWIQFSSAQFGHSVMSDSLWPHELQHTMLSCASPIPGVYSDSSPSSRWCHPTISSSVVRFSSWLQSLPASGSFQRSQLFTLGGQSIGVSASANIQDWFPLGWIGWISLQSKGLSRVFSNITVQKHQFFGAQLSL